MDKLNKYITRFDSFGVNIPFRMDGSKKHKSLLGGVMNIVYYTLTTIYLSYNFYNYASFRNMKTVYSEFVDENPMLINFGDFKMTMAIMYKVNGLTSNILKDYVDWSGDVIIAERNDTVDVKSGLTCRVKPCKNKIPLDMTRPCSSSDFYTIPPKYTFGESLSSNFTGKLVHHYLESTYASISQSQYKKSVESEGGWKCPAFTEGVEGQFPSDRFSYYQFYMTIKKGLNQTQIDKLRQIFEQNEVSINFKYTDIQVDITNLTSPYSHFINDDYMTIDYATVRKKNIYYEHTKIETDDNPLISVNNPGIQKVFVMKSPIRDEQFIYKGLDRYDKFKSQTGSDMDLIAKIYIRSSTRRYEISRTYYKFIEFIADTTSLTGMVYIFFFALFTSINEYASFDILMRRTVKFKGNLEEDEEDFKEFKKLFSSEATSLKLNPRKSSLVAFKKQPSDRLGPAQSISIFPKEIVEAQAHGKSDFSIVIENLNGMEGNEKEDNKYAKISGNDADGLTNSGKSSLNHLNSNANNNRYGQEDPSLDNQKLQLIKVNTIVETSRLNPCDKDEDDLGRVDALSFSDQEGKDKVKQDVLDDKSLSNISDDLNRESDETDEKKEKNGSIYMSLSMCKISGIVCKKYLTYFIKPCFSYKNKNDKTLLLYSKVKKKLFHYLDLVTYIKKFHEIEVLKYLLLTNEQRSLFNFVVKPTVDLVKTDIFDLLKEKCEPKSEVSKTEFEKIHEAYIKLKDVEDNQVDRRLTQLATAEIHRLMNN